MKKNHKLLYSVYETPRRNPDEEPSFHVRPVTYGAQMSDSELKDYLQQNTRVNTSQFTGMIEALREEIPEQLLQNRSVHIEGLGTFYLRMGIRPRKDENGQSYIPSFHSDADITAADVMVEGIGFRADPTWNRRVQKAVCAFERAPYAGHGVSLSQDELQTWLHEYFQDHSRITVRELKLAKDCTSYQARKLLENLCAGPHPMLRRDKVAATFIYLPVDSI
jgi:nucleoid DNA-binding protein